MTLWLGLYQWELARHETSFNNHYDRLDIANQKYQTAITSEINGDPEALQYHLYNMFIFAELDNLEYIILKQIQGYVEDEIAGRAMKHFLARCKDKEFADAANHWVKSAGYQEQTQKVVEELVKMS